MAFSTIPTAGLSTGGANFRNLIINGDMSIAQRGTTATGIGNGDSGYHTVDRWKFAESGSPTFEFTQSQSTDVPTGQGFAKSLKMAVTTADTVLSATDYTLLRQSFEGQNLQHLKKGTANAESLTLSFWTKGSKTGTYVIELLDIDNSRSISKSYTINSASTWEKKTLTFDADTTGTFDNDNGRSFDVVFYLAVGSNFTSGTLQTSWGTPVDANRAVGQVNLADSTSNYINITGVQLEVGTSASDFEFLPYDVNLQRCERYYQILQGFEGSMRTSVGFGCTTMFRTQMRSAPSVTQSGALQITDGNSDFTQSSTSVSIPASRVTTLGVQLYFVNFSGLTQFRPAGQNTNVNDSKVGADAEL
jgi:hypothetical protein